MRINIIMSSLSEAKVVKITELNNHPNGDSLEITEVDGCPVITRKGDFRVGDLAVWVPFDLVLPNTDDFPEFCRGKRVKPVRLRGTFSMGILLQNTWNLPEGVDITERLGISKYEPPQEKTSLGKCRDDSTPPKGFLGNKYDIESLRKYYYAFDGLPIGDNDVIIAEKLDGCCSKFVYQDGQLYVGSRNRWLEEGDNVWWKVANQYDLKNKLSEYPNQIFFGEIFGWIQDLRYDCKQGEYKLAFFDIWDIPTGKFLDYYYFHDICTLEDLPMAPVLYYGDWPGYENVKPLAEGTSAIADNVREGVVVRTLWEHSHRNLGRMVAKIHGEGFLTRKNK